MSFLIAFDKKFSPTKELTTEFSLNTGKNNADQNINETYENNVSNDIIQLNTNNDRNHSFNYKMDYEQMIDLHCLKLATPDNAK